MKRATLILVTLNLLFGGMGQARAGLVTNGSFEDTTNFQDNTGMGTMQLFPGATALTGWAVTNANNLDLAWIGPTNPFGLTASDGHYFLDLTGFHDSSPYSGVMQQNISTVSGKTYLLQLDLGASTTYNSSTGASLTATAGTVSQTFTLVPTSTNQWQTESLLFTASSTSTTISFVGTGSSGMYIGLDNISVTATPEPATITMLGIGIAGMAAYGWRRRKLAAA